MAIVVGFISEKGGVGKTTACYHIAVGLNWHHGKRVLVVDADYQRGGITGRFLPDLLEHFRTGRLPHTTLWDKFQELYTGQQITPAIDILSTQEGPKLIPADPRLSQVTVEKMPATNNIRQNSMSLWRHLSLLRSVLEPHLDNFDYILIDSHPEISEVLRAVIYASDHCVSPVKLDLQSTIGVASAIEAMNDVNADVEMMIHAISNLPVHQPTRFSGAMGMMAREWGGILKRTERTEYHRLRRAGTIFDSYVTEGDGLRQAAAERMPVYNVKGANAERQATQFREMTTEFMTRCQA
ncbi:MAG: ParA family protein [Burkholderiales bacterium]|nr:ParA family protein [Phycisphaerae bacterium]